MAIGLIVDSSASLPSENLSPSIRVVPHFINYDEHFMPDFTQSVSKYINSLNSTSRPKTAHPSPHQFLQAISDLIAHGYDTQIILTVSSRISGTYNSAVLARSLAFDELGLQPTNIHVIDTDQLAMGHGLIALEITQAAQMGTNIDNLLIKIDEIKHLIRSYYLIHDISFLLAGGRIKLEDLSSEALSMWYLLEIKDSQLRVINKAGTYHSILEELIHLFTTNFAPTKSFKAAINYVGSEEIVSELRTHLENYVGNGYLLESNFSAALAIHLGPKAVGLFGYIT